MNRDKFLALIVIAMWLLGLCLFLLILSSCSTSVHCGSKTTEFLGMKFHSPIPQKCSERPNRATEIVGW